MSNKIICPYCFEEFDHDQVLFRSETYFSEEELDDIDEIYEIEDEHERAAALEEYRKKSNFLIGVSKNYTQYWERYSGTTEKTRKKSGVSSFRMNIENYQKPIIDPKNVDHVRFNNTGKTGVKYDQDGFLSSVDDVFGGHTSSRVCPHCHNPLPMNYGKFPIKFISIIGITNSGKTVYLSSLFDNMLDYAGKMGMTSLPSESVNFFIDNNKVARGTVLPQGTSSQQMCQPLSYNLQYIDSRTRVRNTVTFVIYDIAGENCVSLEDAENFGNFIKHSDGIIILEDPNQFKGLHGDEGQTMVDSVLGTINDLFVGKGYCDIPLALCISKSDILINDGMFDIELESKLKENVRSADEKKAFNATEYNTISNKLDNFYIDRDKNTRTALKTAFNNYNYFAVSALNCRLEPTSETDTNGKVLYIPAEKPHPLRIEEPLYWLFTQFGFIESDIPVVNHAIVGDLERLNKEVEALQQEKAHVYGIFKKRKIKELDEAIALREAEITKKMSSI